MNYFQNIFSSRGNKAWSMTKLIAAIGALAMVVNFLRAVSVDFSGLGIGLGAMIAALAAKYAVEEKESA